MQFIILMCCVVSIIISVLCLTVSMKNKNTDEYKREQFKKLKSENQELKRQNIELRKGYPNDTLRNWEINNKLKRENKELKADKETLLIQKKAMAEFINEKGLGKEAELVVRAKIYEKTNTQKSPQLKPRELEI